MVETKAIPSERRSTAASSNGARPISSSLVADLLGDIACTSAESGEPPHFAAQPPHDVHSVSLSVSTARVSQERDDRGRVVIDAGTRVEVRTGFDRAWAKGFEVLAAAAEGYRLRRLSDGRELPHTFPADDVRRERRDANMWWI